MPDKVYKLRDNHKKGIYFLFYFVTILFLFTGFLFIYFPKEEASTLYLLSALAQSQAAIFAILFAVVSLVLKFNTTSSVIVNIILEDSKLLWAMMGFSVFFDLILISIFPDDQYLSCPFVAYFPLFMAILFAVFLYFQIIKFAYDSINVVSDPLRILDRLSYNRDNLLEKINYVSDTSRLSSFIYDLNYPILEFLNNSILRNDIFSFESALTTFFNEHSVSKVDNELLVVMTSSLIDVGIKSISLKNDEATSLIFCKIYYIFKTLSKDRVIYVLDSEEDKILSFILNCARNSLEISTISGMKFYDKLKIISNVIVFSQMLNFMCAAGKSSAENKLTDATSYAIDRIQFYVEKYLEEYPLPESIFSKVGLIGLVCMENKWELNTRKALTVLSAVAIYYLSRGQVCNLTINILGNLSLKCYENFFYSCVEQTISLFNVLEQIASEKIMDESNSNTKDYVSVLQQIKGWKSKLMENV